MNEIGEDIIPASETVHPVLIGADTYINGCPRHHLLNIIPYTIKVQLDGNPDCVIGTCLCPVVITLSVINGLYDRFGRVQLNAVDTVSVIPPFQLCHVHTAFLGKILSFFPGESDAHWEFTFVDNGKLSTTVEGQTFDMVSNQLMIYAPNQFHDQKTYEEATSYLTVIVDLSISDADREIITNRVFDLDRDSKQVLETFLKTGSEITAVDYDKMMLAIEKIVINLLSQQTRPMQKAANTPMQQKFENELLNEILLYINENIYSPLNVEDLCDHFAISRSSLQSLFRNYVYTAPKEYISNLKLEKSKVLIKESKYTISEISSILGFSSIHYFSRRFKQRFGMNPTDYANKFID